ncbi:hypothetical protein H4Q26_010269 [Puccinia striiformis f. sp. tritici PST-130]|nr:hypothetical protein H4Q26_010269 [Puccinia striiformis f. sp. tritici PST-130]
MTTAHSAQLGSSVPIYTAHAVSVLLPTWQDKIYHELVSNGAAHALSVQERTILFTSESAANLCRTFVANQAIKQLIAEPGLEK